MTEAFVDPIHANLVACLATLHMAIALDINSMRFHNEDPKTTHRDCSGVHLNKVALITDVQGMIVSATAVNIPRPARLLEAGPRFGGDGGPLCIARWNPVAGVAMQFISANDEALG